MVLLTVQAVHSKKSFQRQFQRGSSARAMLTQLSLRGLARLRFRGVPLARELPTDAKDGEMLRVVSMAPLRGGGKVVTRAELQEAFETFDTDKSGTLSVDELVGVFTRPSGGAPVDKADARAFIAQHDKDGDGVLSIDEFVDAMLPPPHFGVQALLASVESGAIAPLRGRFIVALLARGGRLERRQDLPPDAFFSAAELRRLVEALGDDYGLLFVALSYRCAPARLGRYRPSPSPLAVGRACVPSRRAQQGPSRPRRLPPGRCRCRGEAVPRRE